MDNLIVAQFFVTITGDALGETGDVFKQLAEIKDNLVSV